LKHPDIFSAAASWAGALGSRGTQVTPADMAKENADKIRGKVRLLFIVGDKDPTLGTHAPLIAALKELKIDHEYKELPDVGHDLGAYYKQTGAQLVKFVTAEFAASTEPKAL